jgi:subtilisin family serine protease
MKTNKDSLICLVLVAVATALWYSTSLQPAMAGAAPAQDLMPTVSPQAMATVSPQATATVSPQAMASHSVPDRLPGQVLVRYKPADAQSADIDWTAGPLLRPAFLAGQVRVLGQIPQLGVRLLQVPAGSEKTTQRELEKQPGVQYVEPNYRAYALEPHSAGSAELEIPNDAQWPQQWALTKINAPQAWNITHCQGVVIALLDTGAYLEHPDLSNALWTNPGEIPGNGRDDDGNGKVDDVHGWHFEQNCTTGVCLPSENPMIQDENGHGTHVTGIAAAETNNATGIAGVSWGARAMIVRVLDQYGDGYYYDIAAGIVYAADNGARVINLSVGGEYSSQLLQDAVNYAYSKGALVVAAAGNSGGAVFYPAACDHVMAVAATDANDQHLSFSNRGPEVDIAAPGDNIISTWPLPYLYYYKRGTSMAAPHVSAAAALLWSWRPDWSNQQVQERLQSQADDVNSALYPGPDDYLGWGRLNLYRVLADLPPGPTPTVSPEATATVSPQATATVSPEATATVSPQATATVSPQATATVSPQATASPTSTIPPPVYRIYVPLGWPVSGAVPPFA